MPQTFIVDQAATFEAVAFLGAEPRIAFGTRDQQETTKDGTPKWDVTVVAGFIDNFGKTQHETMRVGLASAKDPAEGLGMYTPVQLVNFTVGVMERKAKDDPSKVIGFNVWYRCDALAPATAAAPKAPRQSAPAGS